jgi:hypothetical protein
MKVLGVSVDLFVIFTSSRTAFVITFTFCGVSPWLVESGNLISTLPPEDAAISLIVDFFFSNSAISFLMSPPRQSFGQ